MKKLAFVIVFVLSSGVVFSQHIKFNWQDCFEQPGSQKNVVSSSIASTSDGYLILSTVEMETGGLPNGNLFDMWLIKIDTAGSFLWEKYIGGSLWDNAVNIMDSKDGNYYIFGSTNSIDGGVILPPYLPDGGAWYIKIDSEGNKLWDLVAGSPIPCWGYGASSLVTFDSALLSTVNICGGAGGDVSNYIGGYDAWLLKVNKYGIKEWDLTLGTDGFDDAGVTIQTSDSGFLVPMQCLPGNYGNIICDTSLQSTYISRAVLVKLDKNRNIQWQNCLGASEHIGFNNALEVKDGYLTGGYAFVDDGATSGTGYHYGYTNHGNKTADIWLRKIDFDGNLIWQKCYGGSGDDWVSQLFNTSDGNIMVFGGTNSHNWDVKGLHYDPLYPSLAKEDIWIFKIDGNNGDLLWSQCIGDRGDERMEEGVSQLDDKNYVLAAQAYIGQLDDIKCGPYPSDKIFAWVISITDTTAYAGEAETQEFDILINIYPNPAREYITVEIPDQLAMKQSLAMLVNSKGETIRAFTISGKKTYLDTANLPEGLYLINLYNQNTKLSRRFLKQ